MVEHFFLAGAIICGIVAAIAAYHTGIAQTRQAIEDDVEEQMAEREARVRKQEKAAC